MSADIQVMEVMTIMGIKVSSLEGIDSDVLTTLRELMNASLKHAFITDHMLERCTTGDPNFRRKDILVAYENDELVGVLIGGIRRSAPPDMVSEHRSVGWVKAVAVRPGPHRAEILGSLLREFEGLMKEEDKNRLRACDFASWHFFPGIEVHHDFYIEELMRHGFSKVGECVDYEVDLLRFYVPQRIKRLEERLMKEGLSFKRASRGDEGRVAEWVKRKFSSFWAYEAKLSFSFKKPKIWVAEKDGRILGFSVYGALEPNWFGPIGVDPEARARGIGSVLLFKCLQDMRLEGTRIAVIPWTSHLFFYTQVPGISAVKHYWIMEKKL